LTGCSAINQENQLFHTGMKFLFNDGSGKIRELSSKEELDYYISISPDKQKLKIWLYHSSSWISYEEFLKRAATHKSPWNGKPETVQPAVVIEKSIAPTPPPPAPAIKEKKRHAQTVTKPLQLLLNICIVLVVAGGVYAALFYSQKEWTDPQFFDTTASRPHNTPPLNADSLIHMIEVKEKRTLDKLTKMNLRLRNNWPEKIVLTLQGQQQTHLKNDSIRRFENLQCIVKNFTGYTIDHAVVMLQVWQSGSPKIQDTFRLEQIDHRGDAYTLNISNTYKGDSLTIRFSSIRSFGLNFCYSYEEPTISGNPNDKWFCKD
jgi:hypothetical protein